jgi:hypothetical protein
LEGARSTFESGGELLGPATELLKAAIQLLKAATDFPGNRSQLLKDT